MSDQSKDSISLKAIIESNLETLRMLGSESFDKLEDHWYAQVLAAYYLGRVDELQNLIQNHPFNLEADSGCLLEISKSRLLICTGEFSAIETLPLQRAIAAETDPLLKAEGFFVLSSLTSYLEDHQFSHQASMQSARYFREVGAHKKSVRAALNAMAEESCLKPQKSYVADYLFLSKLALQVEELPTAAACFYNISCELKKVGALTSALEYVQRSVTLLGNEIAGRFFYKAIAHRADIYSQLDKKADAQRDFELLLVSPFPDTNAEADTLLALYPWLERPSHRRTSKSSLQTPNWRERVGLESHSQIGRLEEKLILLLLESKQERVALIEKLYGDKISFEFAENRFKSVLNRVRKKLPGLIVVCDGVYELQMESDSIEKIKMGIV